jgi:hypothetical protein
MINKIMESKYQNWYNQIIKRARNRILDGYTETHHVVPRSLGGDDSSSNLVNLTAREHFICHILLTKFTSGQDRHKMLHAAIIMKSTNRYQDRYFNSRLYETVRKDYAIAASERQLGELNYFYGKKHNEETRKKMSVSKKALYGEGKHPHIGMKRSEEAKANISKSKKGKPNSKKGKPGKLWSDEQRSKMQTLYAKGTYTWWTDGINNVRASDCPPGYKKGRTMSPSHLSKFTSKS